MNAIHQQYQSAGEPLLEYQQHTVTSEYRPIKKFNAAWWVANRMDLRLADWCDALTRDGELFVVLYPAADGMTQVRVRPASVIGATSYCTYDAFARYGTITYEN